MGGCDGAAAARRGSTQSAQSALAFPPVLACPHPETAGKASHRAKGGVLGGWRGGERRASRAEGEETVGQERANNRMLLSAKIGVFFRP